MRKPVSANKLWLIAATLLMMAPLPAMAAKFDCDKLRNTDRSETYKIDPADMRQCIMRAKDPPVEWRQNAGKSPGIRVGGAAGFLNSAVVAPEATAGAYGANASVSKKVIKKSCEFPPRISISGSGIKLPKGSCYDFFNDLLKDVNGDTKNSPEPPASVPDTDMCPAESDTTGAYGEKKTVSSGSVGLECGGMLPTTNIRMVLNKNPGFFALTRNGYRDIWFYRKSGSSYSLISKTILPTYLCMPQYYSDNLVLEKSVDLTPSISQAITYDASVGAIFVRLQSRETMDPAYIPEYNPDEPEKYIKIPIDGDGNPSVPATCSEETYSYLVPSGRQDIVISPPPDADGSCASITVQPVQFNEPIITCPAGATLGADKKCRDNVSGVIVKGDVKDNFVWKCPDTTASGGYSPAPMPAPESGCPQAAGIPSPTDYQALCPDTGQPPVGGKCAATGDMTIEPPSCSTPVMVCDIVTLAPNNATGLCSERTQYGVLNRPGLYYPSGSTAKLFSVASQPFSMAETVDNARFFATGETDVEIGPTAPPITLDDGAMIRLKDNRVVVFNPPVTIDAASGKVIATGGGELLTAGGTQEKTYPASSNPITELSSQLPSPLQVRLGRSFTLPGGYHIQTMNSPYMRLPQEPMPQ